MQGVPKNMRIYCVKETFSTRLSQWI